jgi:hypothetical protein
MTMLTANATASEPATAHGSRPPSIKIGVPAPLFEANMLAGPTPRYGYAAQWDIAPDGRFLLNVPVEDSTPSTINVVVNWRALLNK